MNDAQILREFFCHGSALNFLMPLLWKKTLRITTENPKTSNSASTANGNCQRDRQLINALRNHQDIQSFSFHDSTILILDEANSVDTRIEILKRSLVDLT
jgi:hypothetical protein